MFKKQCSYSKLLQSFDAGYYDKYPYYIKQHVTRVIKRCGGSSGIVSIKNNERYTYITPSTRHDGLFQLTYFDSEGPWQHLNGTLYDLLDRATGEGYIYKYHI